MHSVCMILYTNKVLVPFCVRKMKHPILHAKDCTNKTFMHPLKWNFRPRGLAASHCSQRQRQEPRTVLRQTRLLLLSAGDTIQQYNK